MPKYREDTKFVLEVSYAKKLAKRLELYQEQGVFEESGISTSNLFDKTRNKNGSNFTQK